MAEDDQPNWRLPVVRIQQEYDPSRVIKITPAKRSAANPGFELSDDANLEDPSDYSITSCGDNNEALQSKKYFVNLNREHVYSKSEDKNGHDHTVRGRIPKFWLGLIGMVKEKIPLYKSESDFVRDAIIHRLKDLCELLEEGSVDPHACAQIEQQVINDRLINYVRSFAETMQGMEAATKAAASVGDWEGADLHLEDAANRAADYREPYRSKMLVRITELRESIHGMIRRENFEQHFSKGGPF